MDATSENKKQRQKSRSRSRVTARWKKAGTTGEASGAAVPRAEEAGAAGVASSAALPRAEVACRTPLRQLNSTNANLATWDVYIEHAHVEDYEYVWEGKHRKRPGLQVHASGRSRSHTILAWVSAAEKNRNRRNGTLQQ